MFNYTKIRINELWPEVAKIVIQTKQIYVSAFGKFEDEKPVRSTYTPDRPANFFIRCINRDCTMKYFDLDSAVSSMIAHHQEHATGTLECQGKEAEDHPLNRCPCTLDYNITIEYKS